MTHPIPASVALSRQADELTHLAHCVAMLADGERLGQSLAFHAARLAVASSAAALAEAEAAADRRALATLRSLRETDARTIAELTRELLEQAALDENSPAAMEHRRQQRATLARAFPGLLRPEGGCHLSGGGA